MVCQLLRGTKRSPDAGDRKLAQERKSGPLWSGLPTGDPLERMPG
jgi:hypothetical protein